MTRIESIGFSSETKTTLKHLADQAKHNKDLPLFHRIMGLLLISQKWDVESVAEAYGVTPRSVYYWITRFLKDRFTWLIVNSYKKNGAEKN